MTIENLNDRSLSEVQNLVKDEINKMIISTGHSVAGSLPDENGKYSDQRMDDKEKREILNEIITYNGMLNISESQLSLNFASSEDYLQAFVDQIQYYPENVCVPICEFIKNEFGLQFEYKDRNEVDFDNKVYVLMQIITLSEDEIHTRLGGGKFDEARVEEVIEELIEQFPKSDLMIP